MLKDYEIAAERHFAYSIDNGRDDCGGTGPDVGCDGVCFSGLVEDCNGDCNGTAVADDCGVCEGDNSDIDDCGVCFGSCDFGFEYQSEYQAFYHFSSATLELETGVDTQLEINDKVVAFTPSGVMVGYADWDGEAAYLAVMGADPAIQVPLSSDACSEEGGSFSDGVCTIQVCEEMGTCDYMYDGMTPVFKVLDDSSGTLYDAVYSVPAWVNGEIYLNESIAVVQDCNFDLGGSAFEDSCGVCSGGNSGHEADSDIDCNGDCFGTAFVDDCGVCSEGNSGHAENSDQDCAGVCFGDSYVDECGACNADSSDDFVCLDITGLNATGGLNEVFLQWDYNPNVSSYNIYRDGELVASTPAEVPGYVDSTQGDGFGLGYDTQYCYTITGVSATDADGNGSLGEGADSDAACATTLPPLQAFLQVNTSLANQEVAAVASPFGDLTGDGVADGVIMVEMVNLLPVNGYQFDFALTPDIVDVVSALDGTSVMTGGAAGLMAQMGPNTVIGFDMTGQGSIPAAYPGNPTGVEGNLLAILVLDSEYSGVGSEVAVTISDFVVSGIYNGQNIGLASCDADQDPFNGCFDTDVFATPTADCAGIPAGDLIVDSCGDCVAAEVDSDNDGTADSCDACPNDADNDADGDGVCGDVDTCPGFDDNQDADSDGLADGCDACPNDDANDADGDGVCGDVDICEGHWDNIDFDGDGIPDGCDDSSTGDMTLSINVTSEGSADVNFSSNVDIYGFQFDVSGVTLTGASGELSDISFSAGTGMVLGFDLSGGFLPAGDGTLVSLTFDPIVGGSTLSIAEVAASGIAGNMIMVMGPEDAEVAACANADNDNLCDVADDCPLDADNDADGDGVCGDVDTCPGFDDNQDADSDGLADDCDDCPLDADNDADGDGVCGDVDVCEGYDDNLDTDGDGTPNGCDETQDGDIVLSWTSDSESHATLSYVSNVDIYGFQLNVAGVDLTAAYDGVLDVQFSETTQNVIAFSIDGEALEAGTGTLVTFEFEPVVDGTTLSLSDLIVVGQGGATLGITDPGTIDIMPCANNDGDDLCNVADDCPEDADNDADGDGVCGDVDVCWGDDAIGDTDGDGSCDDTDVCPNDADNDADADGYCADVDNCPADSNADQADYDSDGEGDVCDADDDNDGVADIDDSCAQGDIGVCEDPTSDGTASDCDYDGDGCSNNEDTDDDGDGVADTDDCAALDETINSFITGYVDADLDGVSENGDAVEFCSLELPEGYVSDAGADNCPLDSNADQSDVDSDGEGDVCDACPNDSENDADNDGVCGDVDLCEGFDDNLDADGDGMPDACDECPADFADDSDGDGSCDSDDACPGFDDNLDSDGDSVADGCDVCHNGDDTVDTDSDGMPNDCDVDIDIHEGNNLVSFHALPDNGLDVDSFFGGSSIYQVIGEGLFSKIDNVSGGWIGNLESIAREDGYWVRSDIDTEFEVQGENIGSITYQLHEASNLISYPYATSQGVQEAIPSDVTDATYVIIGEGLAAYNYNGAWVGSLADNNFGGFKSGKGYWFKVRSEALCPGIEAGEPCDELLDFEYNTPSGDVDSRLASSSLPIAPEGFEYTQSTAQGFYFVESASFDGVEAVAGDWIVAYNDNVVVGSWPWTGEFTTVPTMGYDGTQETAGYMEEGQVPTFKLLKSEDGSLNEMTMDVVSAWTNNGHAVITLTGTTPLPEAVSLNDAYPNPFNPSTNISFEIPQDMHVNLSVYDINGRIVAELVNEMKTGNTYSVAWNASGNASGVYFVKLAAGEVVHTQKIMLVK